MILDNVPSCKGNIVQASRLRVAWEQARAELDGSLKRKDLGLPMDDFSVENLHNEFMQVYSFRMGARSHSPLADRHADGVPMRQRARSEHSTGSRHE
jgi:hypothetical protein